MSRFRLKKTDVTKRLKNLAEILIGHKNIENSEIDVVVTSTAVTKDNPEVLAHSQKFLSFPA